MQVAKWRKQNNLKQESALFSSTKKLGDLIGIKERKIHPRVGNTRTTSMGRDVLRLDVDPDLEHSQGSRIASLAVSALLTRRS